MEAQDEAKNLTNATPFFFGKEIAPEETRELFLFELDQELYAAGVEDIDQVLKIPPVTAVPNAPESILGIFHLRGRVIVAIDLLKRMHLVRKSSFVPNYLFVAHYQKNYFAPVVDKIFSVVRIPVNQITPPIPLVSARIDSAFVKGTFLYKERNDQVRRKIPNDIMIEKTKDNNVSTEQFSPGRPVVWLNMEALLNQSDFLGVVGGIS